LLEQPLPGLGDQNSVPLLQEDATPLMPPALVASAPAQSNGGDVVYSSADADVRPPILLGRPIPSSALQAKNVGFFDITIDEQGRVDLVRLVPPSNGYHERMLLAAAKAWRFEPAMRQGQPVKYRTQIRITW
jgi:TonB family protein